MAPLRTSLIPTLLLATSFVAVDSIAQTTAIEIGTDAPPTSLNGYSFIPFGPDTSPIGSSLFSITSPLGGELITQEDVLPPYTVHYAIGNGWATWSHGYTGDVYTDNTSTGLTFTLPPGTGAFYFYAEPNPQYPIPMTVTDDSGSTIFTSVLGDSGADGFAFAAPQGQMLSTIRITSLYPFAVGEFGIASAVPEPVSGTVAIAIGMVCFSLGRAYHKLSDERRQ